MKSVDFLRAKLHAYLEAKSNAPKTYKQKVGIKPSEIGSACIRKAYYSYFKTPSSFGFPVENIKSKESGDRFHAQIREWYKDMGILVENLDSKTGEVPISFINGLPDPEYVIQNMELGVRWAKADGIIRIDDEGPYQGLWVLEIKSKKPDKFKKVSSPEYDVIQGNFYAFELDAQLKTGKLAHIPGLAGFSEIRGSVYVYIDRGDGETKEYFVEKDPKVLETFITRVVTVLDHADRDELPEKTPDRLCPWCPWRDKCAVEFKPVAPDAAKKDSNGSG